MSEENTQKIDYTLLDKGTTPLIMALEKLHTAAKEFVRVKYAVKDNLDRNIKVLATMNQLIEIRGQNLLHEAQKKQAKQEPEKPTQ